MDAFWIGVVTGAIGVIVVVAVILGLAWWADGPNTRANQKMRAMMNRPR